MIQEFREKWKEIEAQKRAEIEGSLERGEIGEPISLTAIAVSLAVSAAVSTASYLVSRALTPKPPRQQQGKLTGSLQLQNSEQGIFIPEVYGASPSTSLVTGSDPTYQNLANVTTGAGGAITKTSGGSTTWNAGASHNVAITAGQDAFYEFIVGTGYATAGFTLDSSPTSGNTDFLFAVQWNPDGSISIKYSSTQVLGAVTTWVTGDKFRLELRSGRFRLYKGSAEIVPPNFIFPAPSYPLYVGIAMQVVGAGVSASKVQIDSIGAAPNSGRGGVKLPAIIVWSSGIRKIVTPSEVTTGGGKGGGGRTQTVDNITYDIDLGLEFGRGPNKLIRLYGNADILIDQFDQSANPSGVYDPGTGPDPDYDPTIPPDPTLNYDLSFLRADGDISFDGDNVGTGTIHGGGTSFAIYEGNDTQQPDPIIEADVDAKYGAGSTPAYRNHTLVRLSPLSLSRWGGVAPNITGVWEHATLKTLDLIFASLCERVGVKSANGDYDFTAIPIASRGLVISGRSFAPKEVIGSPDIQLAYNYFATEADGQIICYPEGGEPSITIPDTEVGWLEGDADLPDVLPEVDSIIAPEITLPREVHVKSIDPDSDWEPNTQSAMRQITDGSAVEMLEIQITQLSDERRETAQRKLYRSYVAGTAHKFTLPWTYLYLHPGYKITITRAEGFSHVLRLTSIAGGIGLLECEGVALEPETFNQPANGVFPPGYIPPQPIPAMIVMSMLDIPTFRDADEGRLGFYACGTPRTGVNQTFNGWAAYSQRNSVWTIRASSKLPGIIGVVVSATTLSNDPEVFDNVGTITVDLYGTTMTLSSVTESDVLAGMDWAVAKDFLFGFTTATQVAGFPNRWTLSGLLNGLRGTEESVTSSLAGARFVLLDNAVTFVETESDEVNLSLSWRGVANGQSLGDAATFSFAWTAVSLKAEAPTDLTAVRDSSGDWFISAVGHPREAERPESYIARIRRNSDGVLMRDIPVSLGIGVAAIFTGATGSVSVSNNNVSGTSDSLSGEAHTTQEFNSTGMDITARVTVPNSGNVAVLRLGTASWSVSLSRFSATETIVSFENWSGAAEGGGGIFVPTVNGIVYLRIVLIGTELRFYLSGSPLEPAHPITQSFSDVPVFPSPASLYVLVQGVSAKVEDLRIGGSSRVQAIYKLGEQETDNSGSGIATSNLSVEVWQVSPLAPNQKGISVKGVF